MTPLNTAKPAQLEQPFVLAMPAAFWWPVKVPSPNDGDYTVATFDAFFEPVDQDELDKMRGIGLGTIVVDGQEVPEQAPSDIEIVRRVLRGWRKVKAQDGSLLEFSPDALETLLRVPLVRSALVATYLNVMLGMGARKNV